MAGVTVHGEVAPAFERVADAFAGNFRDDTSCPEVGAALSVVHEGAVVVDVWAGHADAAKQRPWRRDTMVNTYSTTKGIGAICIAVLEARGLIDYRKPVAHYWPEFAAAGKGDITVGMLLSHQAGLSGVHTRLTIEDLFDWERITRLLAAAEPLWPPGSQAGYHAITWGFLAGELVRRVTGGTRLRDFLQSEIAAPLDADYHIGTPQALTPKIAEMIPPRGEPHQTQAQMSEIVELTLLNPLIEAGVANRLDFQLAELPALNGTGTARGIAALYAPFAHGGAYRNVRLLDAAAVERARAPQFSGIDINLGTEVRWGAAGFFGNNPLHWYGPHVTTFGHSGWGGSMGYADPEASLSVGYVLNQMDANLNGDPRGMRIVAALYESLEDMPG
jgi:CubicO group peptidase (beta-lactamase class C family)